MEHFSVPLELVVSKYIYFSNINVSESNDSLLLFSLTYLFYFIIIIIITIGKRFALPNARFLMAKGGLDDG